MQDTYSLGDYAGLIFTKLDLPPVPDVDADKVLEWMNSADRKVMHAQIDHYHETFKTGKYPWRPVWAHDGEEWDLEFSTQFPELVQYIKLFPATAWRRVCLLAQLPNETVFRHTDPDLGLGWRVYLTSGGPKMYFSKFKDWHKDNADSHSGIPTSEMLTRTEPERIYAPLPTAPYPYALTSICAAHSVEENTNSASARIVVLIFPEQESINIAAHHDLLRRSTWKYAADAIWY